MAVLLLLRVLHHSWAGAYSFCCFLCSVLPGTSPAAPPAHSPAFFTLQGGSAALGMQVIPAGKVPVLSRWQDSLGRNEGDTSLHPGPCQHRGSRGILDQKSL